jgi:hypothetical protein
MIIFPLTLPPVDHYHCPVEPVPKMVRMDINPSNQGEYP